MREEVRKGSSVVAELFIQSIDSQLRLRPGLCLFLVSAGIATGCQCEHILRVARKGVAFA
jgi:hypothetical protein